MDTEQYSVSSNATHEAIKEQFVTGLAERFNSIENLLCGIRKHEKLSETLPALFRSTHNLKGSTSTFGMHVLATICHQLEDYLKYAGKLNKVRVDDVINVSLKYIDLMRCSLDQNEKGNMLTPCIDDDLSELQKIAFHDHAQALIVTDSKSIRYMCNDILEPFNIHPTTALDGIDALRRLTYQRFNYLITTLEIQGINGLALINTVHLSSSRNDSIKSILVTSNETKKIPTYRNSDPDAIVYKNQMFMENMTTTVYKLMQ